MFQYFLLGVTGIIFFAHTALRYLNSLHMFQQNIYNTKRYVSWCIKHPHKSLPFTEMIPLFLWLALYQFPSIRTIQIILSVTALFYLIMGFILHRARKEYVKLPLVFTPRVQRLVVTSVLVIIIVFYLGYFAGTHVNAKLGNNMTFLIYIILNLFIYAVVIIANFINYPMESLIRKRFMNEASEKMQQLKNKMDVVGITGSYGKTTTKNIVTHILNQEKYALMTPASYNTPMGLTITIREKLKPIHDVFVAEMGAYKVGEIAELAELVSPKYGILTAIGPQHLNTFKTIENVQKTKFELIESLDDKGVAVLNIDDPLIAGYEIQSKCRKLTYSLVDKTADFFADNIQYSEDGIAFDVQFPNKEKYHFTSSLLGEHNIQNILAGTAVAYDMGLDVASIQKAVTTLPQVEHRLEIKKSGHFTIIDDAFNANPVGTKKAIDVLTKMNGKKIVITPGMIELGREEEALNKAYGEYMSDKVDVVILVGKSQTQAIYDGLLTKMKPEQIIVAHDLQEAFAAMYAQAIPGSFVLIANDLPDTYNE